MPTVWQRYDCQVTVSTSSSLKVLAELAQQRADAAAKELGKLNTYQQEAEKKLDLLVQYRQSYQAHFQNAMHQGYDHAGWQNFMAFIDKLDVAIAEQRQVVSYAQKKRIAGADAFLAHQRKLKSYDILLRRQQAFEDRRQHQQEQKLLDEFSLNALHRDGFPPKAE